MTETRQKLEESIYIYHTGVAEGILGPGKRLVVWTSGCPFNCPGCIEPALHEIEAGEAWDPREFLQLVSGYIKTLRRVTFSGGEPLYQADSLLILLEALPSGTDIMLYTGYELEDAFKLFPNVVSIVDILISGPYQEERAGGFLWRGSDNQIISSPTNKYSKNQLQAWMDSPSAGLEIHSQKDRLFIYGVPPKHVLDKLNAELAEKGFEFLNDTHP